MKDWLINILPDEVLSAHHAKQEMHEHLSDVRNKGAKLLVSFLPFIIGAGIGLAISDYISTDTAVATLTVSGVLAGFVVTMMLFTGRVDGAQNLNLAQSIEYKKKIVYLLWSQITSLGCYLMSVLISIIWIVFDNVHALSPGLPFLSALLIGLLLISIVRTFILPYQIFELHNFSLSSLVLSKEDEERKKLEEFKSGFDD